MRLEDEPDELPGGCSLGCAVLFVISAIWPLLHVIGRTYEPETWLVSFLIGGPSFLVTHIFAVIALRSESSWVKSCGKWALRLVWVTIALFLVVGLIGAIIESISK